MIPLSPPERSKPFRNFKHLKKTELFKNDVLNTCEPNSRLFASERGQSFVFSGFLGPGWFKKVQKACSNVSSKDHETRPSWRRPITKKTEKVIDVISSVISRSG